MDSYEAKTIVITVKSSFVFFHDQLRKRRKKNGNRKRRSEIKGGVFFLRWTCMFKC